MKLFSVEKLRFRQDRPTKVRDAEGAVQASSRGETSASVSDPPRADASAERSAEFLYELHSAASMIMDREECEALLAEMEQLKRSHPVAA